MKIVNEAIARDGLALARVPADLSSKITKYGGTDPIEALKFKVSCFPEIRSWKIPEGCILSAVRRLDNRLRMVESIKSVFRPGPELKVYEDTEVNVFRDMLMTLMRPFHRSFMEIEVCIFLNYQFRMWIRTRS
jgi:hypothetical protein